MPLRYTMNDAMGLIHSFIHVEKKESSIKLKIIQCPSKIMGNRKCMNMKICILVLILINLVYLKHTFVLQKRKMVCVAFSCIKKV